MSGNGKGWLIYKKNDAERNYGFIGMLQEEARLRDIRLLLVFEEDLSFGVRGNKFAVTHPLFDIGDISFAIMRAINPLLSKQLEQLGIVSFNSSSVSEICNDKALTYQFAAGLGIPMLDTYFVSHEMFDGKNLGVPFPIVLKQSDGRGGKEVFLVHSVDEILDKLREAPAKKFVLQAFSDNPGKDIRVFVLGNRIIGAVLRESSSSFKANYTLGGTVRPYLLNEAEKELVGKISSSLNGDFIGIDFLINKNGDLLFNEIEDVVGCRSLYSTSDVNAAALYMDYILKVLKKG
jgi:gamma-F420-2:alpha-L-glutamate ligase